MTTGNNCYDILPSILNIHGRFHKGVLNGKATITYNDETKLKANFIHGVIHGNVRLFTKHNELQGTGLYADGLPHGPFWFIYKNQYVQVHFERGNIIEENVIMTNLNSNLAIIGELINSTYLVNARQVKVDFIGEYKCMQVICIPTELSGEPLISQVKIPLKIIPMIAEQRIMVKPSKIMYFNRVAKTGSQSFIKLFKILGEKLGISSLCHIV